MKRVYSGARFDAQTDSYTSRGVLPEKSGGDVRLASQNSYPQFKTKSVIFPNLFMTWPKIWYPIWDQNGRNRYAILPPPWAVKSNLRGYGTLKYGDVHEKFNFLEIQDLRPLRTCQKHFETILPNFLPDECEI